MREDVFRGLGVEVSLKNPEDFLKVKETLTRVGVASKRENSLYQSCHILHKQGRYSIMHFKELFALDGKPSEIAQEDIARRNTIASLLQEWGLVSVLNTDAIQEPRASISQVKVLPFREKDKWTLVAKYAIGRKR